MALISAGQLLALSGVRDQPERPVRLDGGLMMWGDRAATYDQLWRLQPHVRTVVDFLARSVAQLGLHAFERLGDGDRKRVDGSSPLGQLMQTPAADLIMVRWLDRVMHDLAIYDRHLSVKVRDRFGRLWLQPVMVKDWTPLESDWTGPSAYRVGRDGRLSKDQVFAVFGYAPDSLSHGSSPMESLQQLLAGYSAAEQARKAFWVSGSQVRGVIERPIAAPPVSAEGLERLRQDWEGRYTGSTSAGRTPLLEDGMSFKPVTMTAKDAEYLQSRKLTREEVAAAYHVPAPFVGILDHATFSNIREQHKQLYTDCLGPWLRTIEGEFERQVLGPEFGSQFFADFNEGDRLRGTFEERAAVMSTAIGGPWMTRNEGRQLDNLPRLDDPDADQLITPMNVTAGGQASPQSGKSGRYRTKSAETVIAVERSDKDAEEIAQLLAEHADRLGRSVASALGAKSDSADAVDRTRWDSELAADLLPRMKQVAERSSTPVATGLGVGGWSPDVMDAWLAEHADGSASALNDELFDLIDGVEPGEDQTLGQAISDAIGGWNSAAIAGAMALGLAGWAAIDTAKRSEKASKRWTVTSARPRATCAQADGETVPLDTTFSNGLRWPGDGTGSADATAGCTCDMEIVRSE